MEKRVGCADLLASLSTFLVDHCCVGCLATIVLLQDPKTLAASASLYRRLHVSGAFGCTERVVAQRLAEFFVSHLPLP